MGEDILGAIFPVPYNKVLRIFDENKPIFIKPDILKKLKKDFIIVFYASQEKKCLIGEAKIEKIEDLPTNEIWKKYKDKLFLSRDEFQRYISKSKVSNEARKIKFKTFTLKEINKYKRCIKIQFTISLIGRYLKSKTYKLILSHL